MGVAKFKQTLVEGSSMRHSKDYTESPEFLLALGIFIFMKKSVTKT